MRCAPKAFALVVMLGLGAFTSCTGEDMTTWSTESPPPAPCQGGACTPAPPAGWTGPVWLWSGAEAEAPPCPESAPDLVYEGHAGLQVTASCGACACSATRCVLPTGLSVSLGGPHCAEPLEDVLAPPGWDGSCFSIPPIYDSTGVLFWGHTVIPCEPIAPNPARQADFAWDTFARACKAAATYDRCEEGLATCEGPPAQGFRQCILREGEHEACPAAYPELRRFHGALDDGLSCTPCTCTLPEDTGCRIFVGLHRDSQCVTPWVGVLVQFEEDFCRSTDIPDRYASIIGQIHPVEPNACIAGGGTLMGQATPSLPTTFCCQGPETSFP